MSRPETVSRSSLSISILLGKSFVDMHAIEFIKQSCLQSTREEIPKEPIRLVSASEGHLVGRPAGFFCGFFPTLLGPFL